MALAMFEPMNLGTKGSIEVNAKKTKYMAMS